MSPAWDSRVCWVLAGGCSPVTHTPVPRLPLDVGWGWGEELWAPRAGRSMSSSCWGKCPAPARTRPGATRGGGRASSGRGQRQHRSRGRSLPLASGAVERAAPGAKAAPAAPASPAAVHSFPSFSLSALGCPNPALTLPETANLCPAEIPEIKSAGACGQHRGAWG